MAGRKRTHEEDRRAITVRLEVPLYKALNRAAGLKQAQTGEFESVSDIVADILRQHFAGELGKLDVAAGE